MSNFGYLPGEAAFLRGIRELTRELGIVLVYDEVQSLRVAPGGAQELYGVTPDLTCLGKIIGGGLPVGAFGGRRDIMAQFDPTGGGRRAHRARRHVQRQSHDARGGRSGDEGADAARLQAHERRWARRCASGSARPWRTWACPAR